MGAEFMYTRGITDKPFGLANKACAGVGRWPRFAGAGHRRALGRIPEASHHIRKLWATDQDAFCNHLLRLDVDGRHDRFAMGVSDNFIRKYAELCFTMPGSIFGYFSDDALRGAGELRLIGDQGTAAEAAFSVEPGWRRRGVGKELMARIVQAASNARVTTLHMSCLASNRAMQKLAKHFEARG
jgi:GNAT superfamily N-acetyltransferase